MATYRLYITNKLTRYIIVFVFIGLTYVFFRNQQVEDLFEKGTAGVKGHVKATHTRHWMCSSCEKVFKWRSSLNEHTKVKHSDKAKPVTYSEKWIVVTSKTTPSEGIKQLAKLPGWKVLVLGDVNTPKYWKFDNCHFLSYDDQLKLGFGVVSELPKDTYARKNVGYLYAILNGAKYIYDTEDYIQPFDNLQNFVYGRHMTGLMYQPNVNKKSMMPKSFNPYRHFGQPTMWPRGFPLKTISEVESSDYINGKWKTPLVQQGLVDGDTTFRLTRENTYSEFNVRFNKRLPRVIVPHSAYSPYTAKNTFHLYDAFWGLLLPYTVHLSVTDIWRGFWTQRLLKEIDGHIAFFPPNAYLKNSNPFYSDFLDGKLYTESENLIKMLYAWTCPKEFSFFHCAINLMDEMVKGQFVSAEDSRLIRLWIDDLRRINYREPKRIFKLKTDKKKSIMNASEVIYNATFNSPVIKGQLQTNIKSYSYLTEISKLCPNVSLSRLDITNLQKVKKQFNNILLVIVFNNPFYQNVKYLEMMWRLFFPNIVYCGDNIEQFKRETKNLDVPLIFVDQFIRHGNFTSRCMVEVMKMNFDVDGYLYLQDDALLNVWQIYDLPLDRFWTTKPHVMLESKPYPYKPYKKPCGLKAYQNSLKELNRTDIKRYKKFKETLEKNTGKIDGFYMGYSDLVYFPRKHAKDVMFLMDIFCRNMLFHEITIPTTIGAIEPKDNWYLMNGTYLELGYQRGHYENYFHVTRHFMHPFKFSGILENVRKKKFFCDKVISSTLARIK